MFIPSPILIQSFFTLYFTYKILAFYDIGNQRPRCKQRSIKFATPQSNGVFDPRGSRQMYMQACPLVSLLAGIKLLLQ